MENEENDAYTKIQYPTFTLMRSNGKLSDCYGWPVHQVNKKRMGTSLDQHS